MSNFHAPKIFLALFLVLLGTSLVQAQSASPLTATPATVSLTFQKPTTAGSSVNVSVKAAASTYFTVDPATVPFWLSVGAMNGTATSAGVTVSFVASSVAGSLGAGTYGGTVHLKVAGFADATLPVTLVNSDPAATLSVAEGTTQNLTWSQGSAYPTTTLTMVSSSAPIDFAVVPTVTTPASPPVWISVNHSSGVAYTWGTPITVSFQQSVLDAAAVGDTLTGTVTVTPAGGTAIPVAFSIAVQSPAAAITRIYPSQTPVQATALSTDPALTVVVTGTGFVAAPSGSKTVVQLGSTVLATGSVNVISPTTMLLTITPDNFNTAGPIVISAQNPSVSSPSTATLTVTGNPIIYAAANSASLVEAAAGSSPSFAPYDIVTVFGDNFGPVAGTPVTATTDSFGRYPNQLTASGNPLIVTFYKADGTTLIANAYLLFATNNQINLLVPSGITGNSTIKMVVTYNSLNSTAYTANVVTSDPGVFTATSSGVGQGAILHAADYSANSTSNKAAKGSTVLLYLSGLGTPNSTATNTASTTAAAFPAGCISPAAYMGTVNGATSKPSPLWTTVDGAVMVAANIATGHFAPCFASPITVAVTIDGKTATVSYAGWVAGSVAGLYQINAVVPATATSGNAIAVQVSVGTAKSQAGVTMAIQ
jgi:trimeric autotransporter adhesin